MKRTFGVIVAAPIAAGMLALGAGVASADINTGANDGANATTTTTTNSSTTSNSDSGNVLGGVDGNYNATQQSATGSGASNQNNTAAVKGNSGVVVITQGNTNTQTHRFWPIWF